MRRRYVPARQGNTATLASGRALRPCVECGETIPRGAFVQVWLDGELPAGERHEECYWTARSKVREGKE